MACLERIKELAQQKENELCSPYQAFVLGAYTENKTMIEKACKWLEPVFKEYAGYNCGMDLLKGFRKTMEE